MATQVTYPGVYIEEFAPAAPIAGVSTNIAAFIGIAAKGPVGVPTQVTSLDAFTATFGGPLAAAVPYYLPLAVEGFFRNGGTIAYVTRVATAVAANRQLKARSGNALLATVKAREDGAAGAGGSVAVADSTAFTTLMGLAADKGLPVHAGVAKITAIDATRRVLTVDDPTKFQAGDNVVLVHGGNESGRLTVTEVDAATVRLAAAAPNNIVDDDLVRTAKLGTGDTRIRLDVPAAANLRVAAPSGSVVTITDGARTEWAIAREVGADSVTLNTPLGDAFDLTTPTTLAVAEFDLTITDPSGRVRQYQGLSTSPTHPRWWGVAVDDPYAWLDLARDPVSSAYVVIAGADPRPGPGGSLLGASNDDPVQAWANVRAGMTAHLAQLEPIDEISLVAVPGMTDLQAQRAVVEHCEKLFDRFAILDAPPRATLKGVTDHRLSVIGTLNKGFSALYHPWITISDPARQQVVPQPPSGHVAGIFARTDATRGVHKAPANAAIAGAVGLDQPLSDTDNGYINLRGVNALRVLPGQGMPIVWGARTTATDTNWQYINIRRLFLYLEESIQESLTLSVFEPNDRGLWERLKRTIVEFLTRAWRDGALFGATAKEAFYVRIDDVLNPPSTRKLGRLNVEIGVNPVYPAEFIVVRIGIWDGGAEVAEV